MNYNSNISGQIKQKLENIKFKLPPSKYAAAESMIDIYTSYCKGTGYLNQLTLMRLQTINDMTEEEFLETLQNKLS